MAKTKKRTTMAGIRGLLLRLAILITLVGLSGVVMKKEAFAQTPGSLFITGLHQKAAIQAILPLRP